MLKVKKKYIQFFFKFLFDLSMLRQLLIGRTMHGTID